MQRGVLGHRITTEKNAKFNHWKKSQIWTVWKTLNCLNKFHAYSKRNNHSYFRKQSSTFLTLLNNVEGGGRRKLDSFFLHWIISPEKKTTWNIQCFILNIFSCFFGIQIWRFFQWLFCGLIPPLWPNTPLYLTVDFRLVGSNSAFPYR